MVTVIDEVVAHSLIASIVGFVLTVRLQIHVVHGYLLSRRRSRRHYLDSDSGWDLHAVACIMKTLAELKRRIYNN